MKIYLGLLLFLSMAFSASADNNCSQQKAHIQQILAEKNYCNTDDDCKTMGSCAFGCPLSVNKAEADEIRQSIANYSQKCKKMCMYKCPQPVAVCEDKKCVVKNDR